MKRNIAKRLPDVPSKMTFPAYRLQQGDTRYLAFYCPFCKRVHYHGDPNGEGLITGRGHHAITNELRRRPSQCDLLIVGRVKSERSIPKTTAEEALAFSEAMSPIMSLAALGPF